MAQGKFLGIASLNIKFGYCVHYFTAVEYAETSWSFIVEFFIR